MDCAFRDDVPVVEIRGEVVVLTWRSGEKRCSPLDIFRATHLAAAKALAKHDRRLGIVVPIRKQG